MLLLDVAEDIISDDPTWWESNGSAFWVLAGAALTGVIALIADWMRRRHQDKRDRDTRLRDTYARVISCALDFDAAHNLTNPRKTSLAAALENIRLMNVSADAGSDEVEIYIGRRIEETSVAVQAAIAVARAESDKTMALHLDRLSLAVKFRRGWKGLGPEWQRLGGGGMPSVPYEVEIFTDAMRKRFGGEPSGVTRRAYDTEVPGFAERESNPQSSDAAEDNEK